jgi:nitrite reductase/ring-hydroxylating ferredoxin subunit
MLQAAVQGLTKRIERWTALDGLADTVSGLLDPLTRPEPVKKLLSGTWLGHRLHPAVVTVPIGAWSGAAVLDLLDDERADYGADAMVVVGLAASLPSALAGASDWVDTYGESKRVGLVHLTLNVAAVSLYSASAAARVLGRRKAGRALALTGLGTVAVSAWLGGHMSYVQAVGVDRRAFQHLPADWTPALADEELPDSTPRVAKVNDTEVLLYRHEGRLYALANRCGHEGGPLAEGEFDGQCVVCPWHGSTYRLADGFVVRAPASAPQPVLDARVNNGMIEVRAQP